MRAKKFLSAMLVSALLLGLLPAGVQAAETAGNWYDAAMSTCVERGILTGDENGDLQPGRNITRGELAVMLNRIMAYRAKANNGFHDLAEGAYYTDAILGANAAGVLKGDNNGNMNPAAAITRQETAVMLARVMGLNTAGAGVGGFTDQAAIAPWAAGAVNAMKAAGYMGAKETAFRPTDSITKAEVATVLGNIFIGYFNKAETYSGDVNGSAVVSAAGATLKNMKISGDLLIAEGVGEGNVYLEGVTVGGKLLVRGGGANSIYIRGGSSMGTVTLAKVDGKVRVVVEGGAQVEVVVVDDGSDDVKLEGTLGAVRIEGDAKVEIAGKAETVTVDAPDANLTVSGTVAKVETTGNASGAAIQVTAGGKVTAVEAAGAGTQITGSGKVEKVSAQANDVKVTTPNTKVEAAADTTGVVAGEKPVAGGGTATTPGASTGGGGDYVPPDPAIANVATLDELKAALADTTKTTINITGDITNIPATLKVEHSVVINGNSKMLSFENFSKDNLNGEKNGILVEANGVKLKNVKVQLSNNDSTWEGAYGVQIYNATGVVLEDCAISGGDAAILVNGGEVSLKGEIDVSNNQVGGIEVAKNGTLKVLGTLKNESETTSLPTVWVDGAGSVDGAIVNTAKVQTGGNTGKTYYYIPEVKTESELRAALGKEYLSYIEITDNMTEIDAVLEIGHKVTINGNDKTLAFNSLASKPTNTGERNGLLIRAAGVTVNDLKITMSDGGDGWAGVYGIQVYGAQGVTLHNYTGTGGDAALLVNGSAVTLTGTTTVTGNEFGGIEVARGSDLTGTSDLTINGTIVNTSETAGAPTIWVINDEGAITKQGELALWNESVSGKTYYVINQANCIEELLKSAQVYVYTDYHYSGTSTISGRTVTYTPKLGGEPVDMMNDMARFLGALWRTDNGASVNKIIYRETDYTWEGNLLGSNWKNTETTLVSAIVTEFSNAPQSLVFTINDVEVTFVIAPPPPM